MRIHLLSLIALAGCASSGATTTSSAPQESTVRVSVPNGGAMAITTHTTTDASVAALPYSVDQVWRVLPGVLDSLGIPVTTSDPAKHLLANDGLNVRRRLGTTPLQRYLDCGNSQGAPSADTYEVHLTLRSVVTAGEAGSGSTLTTIVEAQARPVSFSGEYVRCGTTGTLEKSIADGVKRRLRG